MLNLNTVQLVGRLTKDPELRKTNSNQSVCSFFIACNRDYKTEGQQEADFISCIAWKQSAEYLTKYASKGDSVAIKGRIQTRSYDTKAGKKVYVTEVLVEHLSIETKKHSESVNGVINDVPSYEDDSFENTPSPDIQTDDLPFY